MAGRGGGGDRRKGGSGTGAGTPPPRRSRLAETEPRRDGAKKTRAGTPRPIQEILGLGQRKSAAPPDVPAPLFPQEDFVRFIAGEITLADLQGITKEEQYQMAEVGYNCLRLGRYKDARTVFEGLLALDPFDAYFHTALGAIAHRTGQLDEAYVRYSRALEINPFSPTARASRGELHFHRGQAASGLSDFLRSIEDDPRAEEGATLRARAAIETLKRVFETTDLEALRSEVEARPNEAVIAVRQMFGEDARPNTGAMDASSASQTASSSRTDDSVVEAMQRSPGARVSGAAETFSDSSMAAGPSGSTTQEGAPTQESSFESSSVSASGAPPRASNDRGAPSPRGTRQKSQPRPSPRPRPRPRSGGRGGGAGGGPRRPR